MGEIKTTVLGAGSWGTALAKLLADQGYPTRLWARREPMAEAIQNDHENRAYLPGFSLPDTLETTSDLGYALQDSELIVSVVPTHGLREVLQDAVPLIGTEAPIVSATKGIEVDSLMLVSEIFEDILPESQHRQLADAPRQELTEGDHHADVRRKAAQAISRLRVAHALGPQQRNIELECARRHR